jgi:DNA-binding NtrC family response regulator
MGKKNRQIVLLVEDELSMAKMIQQYLKLESYEIHHVENGQDALSSLEGLLPQVVLLDLNLPDMDGLDILKHISKKQYPTSVIIITAHGSIETAVKAMHLGALDFLEKPFSGDRLLVTVRNTLERQELTDTIADLKDNYRAKLNKFIGSSTKMQSIYHTIVNVASSKASVLITGESGTGKELCANAIHENSTRKNKPFIAINCAAIPEQLIESEIFGHVKGAFTGATSYRAGALSSASGGTLLLDEICEMKPELQAKLLRTIQMDEVQKIGSDTVDKIDVRIISATNRDPLYEIKQGHLREDLYYRLNVIPIDLPPLRERENDIIELARSFTQELSKLESKEFSSLHPDAEVSLRKYDWPGNVRELRNMLHNIIIMHNGKTITPDMLPSSILAISNTINNQINTDSYDVEIKALDQVEKEYIEMVMDECGGNIPRAATLLGVSPSTIYRKMQSWNEKEN